MPRLCDLCGNFATRVIIKRLIACGYKLINDDEIDHLNEEVLEEQAFDGTYYCNHCYHIMMTPMVPTSEYPFNQPENED